MSFLSKIAISSTLALSVWATAPTALAATIDFVALAANHEGAYSGGTFGNLTLSASAVGNGYSVPYLDDLYGGRPGGLGVCSFRNGACAGKGDDNLGFVQDKQGAAMESLRLAFSSPVTITGLSFGNRDHFALSMQELIIGGIARMTSTLGTMSVSIVLAANEFLTLTHSATGGKKASKARDFYLSSLTYTTGPGQVTPVPEVPIPAALPLLAAGLVGLGFLGRSRKWLP